MSELRRFGLLIGGILAMIGAVVIYASSRPLSPGALIFTCIGGIGVLLVLLGAIAPRALKPVHRYWMAFARALGWFNTRVVLGVVFFLTFPVARLYLMLRGRDPMTRKIRRDAESYWTILDDKPLEPESLEHPF